MNMKLSHVVDRITLLRYPYTPCRKLWLWWTVRSRRVLSGGGVAEVHSVGEDSRCAEGSQDADDVILVCVSCFGHLISRAVRQ